MGARSLIWFFIVFAVYEGVKKILYRREVICPYCGFDMTWYRRDVKMANRLVKDFFKDNPDMIPEGALSQNDLEENDSNNTILPN